MSFIRELTCKNQHFQGSPKSISTHRIINDSVKMTIQSCTKGLTDNAGHEIAGHEFATHDKFVRKYITLQYSVHFFNF